MLGAVSEEDGAVQRLEELVLELTDWCPQYCRHCSSESGPGCRHSLPQELAVDLVRQGAGLGASQVSFGGGEPTAASGFIEVVGAVVKSGMSAEVFTCGAAHGARGPGPLPREVVDGLAPLDGVKLVFSFHGADARLHDSVSGCAGSFERLIASLEACIAAGIACEANFVPLRANAASFGRLIDLCREHGLRRVSVLRFVPQGRGADNRQELELSAEQERAFLSELERLRETSGVAIRTGSPFNGVVPGNCVPCRAGSEKIVVQPDGNVIPCEVYKDAARRAWGLSVYDATLEECLASRQMDELREHRVESGGLACPIHSALRASQSGGPADGHSVAVAV